MIESNFTRKEDIDEIINNFEIDFTLIDKKNILITGSFGFIGKYLLDTLIEIREKNNLKINIFAIDNFITSKKECLNYYKKRNINCIDHDINKILNIDLIFDYVISLAGIASPYYYHKYPIETLHTSILGVQNLFKFHHHKNTKFVYFSSSEIYGDPPSNKIPTSEDYRGNVTSIGPRSCYDESKRVGETICYIQSSKFDKNTAIIRPFNVYGPAMDIKDYRIIPNITRAVIFDEKLKIYDTGKQTRTYCYIVDAIKGFLKVILKKEKFCVYNIGNDIGEINVIDLVNTVEKVIGRKIKYELTSYPEEYPSDQPQRRCPDISKAKNNLGYLPTTNLETGLDNHFEWFRKFKNS